MARDPPLSRPGGGTCWAAVAGQGPAGAAAVRRPRNDRGTASFLQNARFAKCHRLGRRAMQIYFFKYIYFIYLGVCEKENI